MVTSIRQIRGRRAPAETQKTRRQFLRGLAFAVLGTAGGAGRARAGEYEVPPWMESLLEWAPREPPQWIELLNNDLAVGMLVRILDQHGPELIRAADHALREADVEELAGMQPYMRKVVAHAREVPDLEPYAAWLESRLPYFDAARRAASVAPIRSPRRGPPSAPLTPAELARARANRRSIALNPELWKAFIAPRMTAAPELVRRVKSVFRAAGLPEVLVWMAEVESQFRANARSPSGAVGLFQLMPDTARTLGLRLFPADQRRDPELNARAAAHYLRYLHRKFGDWSLVLAAYNGGPARIDAALRRVRGRTFDSIAALLPVETQMYVPRVRETIRIREGIDPARIPAPR
jgi:membrane-bound lytic murein transglycosylase D